MSIFIFYDISSLFFASYFSSGFKVWSFGATATAALAGLMGEMIYSPYDITGIFHWIKQVKIIYFKKGEKSIMLALIHK